MKQPTLITVEKTVPDNTATGKLCREWRRHLGVSVSSIVAGLQLSAAMISCMETGRKGWTKEKVSRYIAAVKAAKSKA